MARPREGAVYRLHLALVVLCALCWTSSARLVMGQTGQLSVDASPQTARKIPDKMFGIFFEVRVQSSK
jgi:alpha-N-arabinofuranosidase